MKHVPIEKIALKHYRLAEKHPDAPKYSFWSFVEACGIDSNDAALDEFYETMEDWFEPEEK